MHDYVTWGRHKIHVVTETFGTLPFHDGNNTSHMLVRRTIPNHLPWLELDGWEISTSLYESNGYVGYKLEKDLGDGHTYYLLKDDVGWYLAWDVILIEEEASVPAEI